MSRIDDILELVDDLYESTAKGLREELDGLDYGTKKATPQQDEDFVLLMLKKYPPLMWTFPDGRQEFNSSWVICLREGIIEEPKGAWRSVMKALERIGPLPLPQPVPGATPQVGPPAVAMQPPAPQQGVM